MASFEREDITAEFRQAAGGIHRRLAVVLGLWVTFQSLTGLILLFGDPLEHWLHPELTAHGHGDRGAAEVLSVVRQSYPGEAVGVLATPAVSDGVYVDPSGPRINGSRDHDAGFVAMIRGLHRRFLFDSVFGVPGTWVVGAFSAAWLGLSLSGAITAVTARLGRWWRHDPAVLYGLIGVLVVAPIVLLVGTGIRLALPAGTDRVWAAVTGSGHGRADVPPEGVRITSDDRGGAPRDATEVLAALQSRFPDGRVSRLLMPRPDDRVAPVIAGLSVGFDPGRHEHDYGGNTVVFLDQFSADTLWVGRPDALPAARQAALLWSRPLHTGSVAGEFGRLVWSLLAAAIAALAALGWITRARRTREARAQQLRWQRQLRRRKALAHRDRTHAARATRIARQRRRTSRRLRRRRKIQARARARMGRVALEAPPAVYDPSTEIEIDLTDATEIDLTDTAGVDLAGGRSEVGAEDAPDRFPPV